jgi:hypothetical protein
LCWTADGGIPQLGGGTGCPVITGSTTYTDLYTNRAFTLDTRYLNTLMRSTIAVTVGVAARRTAGSGTLDVRLTDGTNHLAITGITDGGFFGTGTLFTTTGTLPAALTSTWHLEARQSNTTTTHELYSFIVYPYET